jgi:hypothetical protein
MEINNFCDNHTKPINTVTCMGVRVTKLTGSSSDGFIGTWLQVLLITINAALSLIYTT